MANITVVKQRKASLLPECISELLAGITALCRVFRKSAEGIEVTIDGGIEVTSLLLKQQRERLLSEYSVE
jgi:hypothetical protein